MRCAIAGYPIRPQKEDKHVEPLPLCHGILVLVSRKVLKEPFFELYSNKY